MASVVLPRPLVNRLLAAAQRAAGDGAPGAVGVIGVVGARDGHPHRCLPLDAHAAPETVVRRLQGAGEALFAVYATRTHRAAAPAAAEIARWGDPAPLHLSLCLDTRGVLEIRAFRLQDGEVQEAAVELAGAGAPGSPGADR